MDFVARASAGCPARAASAPACAASADCARVSAGCPSSHGPRHARPATHARSPSPIDAGLPPRAASESAAPAPPPHAERHRVGVRPQRAGYLREAAAVGTRSGMRALPARRACSVLVLATSPGASLSPSASPGASGVLGMPASP